VLRGRAVSQKKDRSRLPEKHVVSNSCWPALLTSAASPVPIGYAVALGVSCTVNKECEKDWVRPKDTHDVIINDSIAGKKSPVWKQNYYSKQP